jgi:hydrogenase maturation protease
MKHNVSRRIIILGLGNLIRSDDGVGIHAIHQLMRDRRIPESVELLDGGTLGLQLLPAIQGVTHLLVLDAINTGAIPGTLARFDMSEMEPLPGSPSVHQIGFADVMAALRLLEKFPQRMILLGVQPEETGWGDKLSNAVQTSLPALIEAAMDELQQWVPQSELVEA